MGPLPRGRYPWHLPCPRRKGTLSAVVDGETLGKTVRRSRVAAGTSPRWHVVDHEIPAKHTQRASNPPCRHHIHFKKEYDRKGFHC